MVQRQQLVKRRRQHPHLLSAHLSKRHLNIGGHRQRRCAGGYERIAQSLYCRVSRGLQAFWAGQPAAVFLGHRLSAMEPSASSGATGPCPAAFLPRCFNGATAFRRWKRSENVRGNRQHPYFNGAVVELQEMTHRAKHIRKGLIWGTTGQYPLWVLYILENNFRRHWNEITPC